MDHVERQLDAARSERQLEAARLALVALLAVVTDEQLRSVKAALEAVRELSETSHTALEELSKARSRSTA